MLHSILRQIEQIKTGLPLKNLKSCIRSKQTRRRCRSIQQRFYLLSSNILLPSCNLNHYHIFGTFLYFFVNFLSPFLSILTSFANSTYQQLATSYLLPLHSRRAFFHCFFITTTVTLRRTLLNDGGKLHASDANCICPITVEFAVNALCGCPTVLRPEPGPGPGPEPGSGPGPAGPNNLAHACAVSNKEFIGSSS